jgi:hypothetical protein
MGASIFFTAALIKLGPLVFVINICHNGEHYETPSMLVGHSDTDIGWTSSIGVADIAAMWAGDVKREVAHHEGHEGIQREWRTVTPSQPQQQMEMHNQPHPTAALRFEKEALEPLEHDAVWSQKRCKFCRRDKSLLRLLWLDTRGRPVRSLASGG